MGIDEVWAAVLRFADAVRDSGELDELRARQATAWMWAEVRDALVDRFRDDPRVRSLLPGLEAEVASGRMAPTAAAARLLSAFTDGAGWPTPG